MTSILITGTSSGIGEATAQLFAEEGFSVIGIARRTNPRLLQPSITQIRFDLSDTDHIDDLINLLPKNLELKYLIHNAATEGFLKSLEHLSLSELRQVMRLNFEMPFLLTQKLLGSLANSARVLHISSGLAHHALAGVSSYCISKSALYMLHRCWNEDLKNRILVGSLDPGIVDTSMQNRLRNSDKNEFASHSRFQEIKSEGLLTNPMRVAQFIRKALLETSDLEFIQSELSFQAL